jgi:hypothetical protein
MVIAIFQFLFGGLGLVTDICAGVQSAGGGQAFMMGGPQGAQQQNLAKDFETFIAEKVPYHKAVNFTLLGLDVLLCVVMLASGVGLLQMQPWGRLLAIFYAGLSILLKIVTVIYTALAIIPIIQEFTGPLSKKGQEQAVMATALEIGTYASAVLPVVFMIYPIIVLIVMLRPSIAAAFRGEDVSSYPKVDSEQAEENRW